MVVSARPLQPAEAPRVNLRFDSLFTPAALEEHVHTYPGLTWTTDHLEYITGAYWKGRTEIGEILELSGPGRGLRGLFPVALADQRWPDRRAALIEALVAAYEARHARLIVLNDREAQHNIQPYLALGFEPIDDVVLYRKPDVQAPAPGGRLRLRPLRLDDLPRLMALEQQVFPWLWWYGIDEWMLITMLSGVETYLAYADGDLVGYETHTIRGDRGHLDRIGVHPDRQGEHLGEELLLRAIARLRALGGRDVGLSTQRDNVRAQALYAKYGFRPTGRGSRMYGRVVDPMARTLLTRPAAATPARS